MRHRHTLTAAALILTTLTACTPTEVREWVKWHTIDPAAALAHLETLPAEEPAPPEPERNVWDDLAWCESGGRWTYNGPSGYDGGLQFLPSVWVAYGGARDFAPYAYQASRSEQIAVAERVLPDVGWQAWPTCSRKLGLR